MPLWRRVLLGLALGVAAGYAVAALRPRRGVERGGEGYDDTRPGEVPAGEGPGEG